MIELLALSVLAGLVTWRLTSLLHSEDAFGWLREWIKIGHDADNYPAIYPDTFWGRTFQCFWCLALAVGVLTMPLLGAMAGVRAAWWMPLWLASSTVAVWLEKQVMRSKAR